jgi:hypothetical protein
MPFRQLTKCNKRGIIQLHLLNKTINIVIFYIIYRINTLNQINYYYKSIL